MQRFLETARKAKDILASSDADWQRIAPLIGTSDAATLGLYRNRYREGIPRRPIADEEADARTLYRVLAQLGGTELVGPASELAGGTFYRAGEDDKNKAKTAGRAIDDGMTQSGFIGIVFARCPGLKVAPQCSLLARPGYRRSCWVHVAARSRRLPSTLTC